LNQNSSIGSKIFWGLSEFLKGQGSITYWNLDPLKTLKYDLAKFGYK
jgi:hypothetical protein